MAVVGVDVVEGFAVVVVVVIVVVVVVIVDVVVIFSAESKNHRSFLKISFFYVAMVLFSYFNKCVNIFYNGETI